MAARVRQPLFAATMRVPLFGLPRAYSRRRIGHTANDTIRIDLIGEYARGIETLRTLIVVLPPSFWKYHHGSPFCTVRTIVSGPSIESMSRTT